MEQQQQPLIKEFHNFNFIFIIYDKYEIKI